MRLGDKLRHLRELEGEVRGLGRSMTQGELVKALREQLGRGLSQSYLSQIEGGVRPHLTHTTRSLLARFFRVHPGYLVDDPVGEDAKSLRHAPPSIISDATLDEWLIAGAERFRDDAPLQQALLKLADHPDSRACLLHLETALTTPGLADRLLTLLRPGPASDSASVMAGAER